MSDKDKKSVSQMIRESWDQSDPSGWFEVLYAAADRGDATVPWAFMKPNPELVDWLDADVEHQPGQSALVVACGLGDDAEELARRGYAVTAFDISETAIHWAERRFPESSVRYQTADLLHPPEEWRSAFDFVLEIRTIQALPHDYTETAIANIAGFVKPGGRLLVMCLGREPQQPRSGIPWPLSRDELALFGQHGLTETAFDDMFAEGARRFRVTYKRGDAHRD